MDGSTSTTDTSTASDADPDAIVPGQDCPSSIRIGSLCDVNDTECGVCDTRPCGFCNLKRCVDHTWRDVSVYNHPDYCQLVCGDATSGTPFVCFTIGQYCVRVISASGAPESNDCPSFPEDCPAHDCSCIPEGPLPHTCTDDGMQGITVVYDAP